MHSSPVIAEKFDLNLKNYPDYFDYLLTFRSCSVRILQFQLFAMCPLFARLALRHLRNYCLAFLSAQTLEKAY